MSDAETLRHLGRLLYARQQAMEAELDEDDLVMVEALEEITLALDHLDTAIAALDPNNA